MEVIGLAIISVAVFWFLGFMKSARRLANMANRAATDLEASQAGHLKGKYTGKDMTEIKTFMEEFDAL